MPRSISGWSRSMAGMATRDGAAPIPCTTCGEAVGVALAVGAGRRTQASSRSPRPAPVPRARRPRARPPGSARPRRASDPARGSAARGDASRRRAARAHADQASCARWRRISTTPAAASTTVTAAPATSGSPRRGREVADPPAPVSTPPTGTCVSWPRTAPAVNDAVWVSAAKPAGSASICASVKPVPVSWLSARHDPGGEGSLHAAGAGAGAVPGVDRVRERDAGRAGLADGGLVDVRRRLRGALYSPVTPVRVMS